MTRRLLESLSGVGALHSGELLLRTVTYQLSLWSDGPPAPSEDSTAVARIVGHIDITGIAEAAVLASPDRLTLTIEDGRRLALQLTSTGGEFVGRGWLP